MSSNKDVDDTNLNRRLFEVDLSSCRFQTCERRCSRPGSLRMTPWWQLRRRSLAARWEARAVRNPGKVKVKSKALAPNLPQFPKLPLTSIELAKLPFDFCGPDLDRFHANRCEKFRMCQHVSSSTRLAPFLRPNVDKIGDIDSP